MDSETVQQIGERAEIAIKDYQALERGGHNENYLLRTEKGALVLRIANTPTHDNIRNEYETLQLLDGRFGPQAHFIDESKEVIDRKYLIEEFIEGEHPQTFDEEYIRTMARLYRELHTITSPTSKAVTDSGTYSLQRKHEPVDAKYEEGKHALTKPLRKQTDAFFSTAQQVAQEYDELFENRDEYSLVHGDPNPENILFTTEDIKFVDWEHSVFTVPEKEIVFFFDTYELDEAQQHIFLESYGYPTTPKARSQLRITYVLHLASMISWAVERLALLQEGVLDTRQKSSDREEITKRIERFLERADTVT